MFIAMLILGVALGLTFFKRPAVPTAIAIFMALVLTPSVASAATGDASETGVVISATGVSMIIGAFIPILTGLITSTTTSGWAKGLITLVANGITSLITIGTLADGTAIISWATFVTWFVGFVTSVGLYTGFWKPAGITSSFIEVDGREVAGKLG